MKLKVHQMKRSLFIDEEETESRENLIEWLRASPRLKTEANTGRIMKIRI
jgi:hypothetical protein